ncbi:Fpg/Nei family DNA glycosylase [Streptomyces sp. NPDC058045]|uniref:Fpg/Nei family DNA glycosylase n=1 Tax=Streptomyces sp. NPDC058045 TaxID=3346311 RepID=UPI0036E4B975
MPEGDTVWWTARRLDRALADRLLVRSDLRVPKLATKDLTGRRLLNVTPRGKHLLARVEGGLTLHSHLQMDGVWKVYPVGAAWRGGPGHQIRAILGTDESTAVGYRLPVLDLLRTENEDRVVGHLGPDLLGPDWNAESALRRLLSDPGRELGEALLDQRNLAGIGNVYKSELCFLAHTTPWTPVGEVPQQALERLVALAHRLLRANRENPTRSTTGRGDQRLFVYGRAPRPCLRCGTPVQHSEQGDGSRQRSTYWCPVCQHGPAPQPPVPGEEHPVGRPPRH